MMSSSRLRVVLPLFLGLSIGIAAGYQSRPVDRIQPAKRSLDLWNGGKQQPPITLELSQQGLIEPQRSQSRILRISPHPSARNIKLGFRAEPGLQVSSKEIEFATVPKRGYFETEIEIVIELGARSLMMVDSEFDIGEQHYQTTHSFEFFDTDAMATIVEPVDFQKDGEGNPIHVFQAEVR